MGKRTQLRRVPCAKTYSRTAACSVCLSGNEGGSFNDSDFHSV
jgi:hypothetical protein